MTLKLELPGLETKDQESILTEGALDFIRALTAEFRPRIEAVLEDRLDRQEIGPRVLSSLGLQVRQLDGNTHARTLRCPAIV